jgi:hypothetical protein
MLAVASAYSGFFRFVPIFSIAFVLLLSCSVVMPPNLVVVVGGVTSIFFKFVAMGLRSQ